MSRQPDDQRAPGALLAQPRRAPAMSGLGNVGWLLGFTRPATWTLLASILSRVVATACTAAVLAVPAWAIGVMTRQLASGEQIDVAFVIWVVVAFALLSVIKAVTRYTEQLLGHTAAFRLLAELRIWIIDRLIPQAPAVTDGVGVARLQTVAIRDVDRIEVFFAHTIAPAITAVLIPSAAVVMAWLMTGWQVGLTLTIVLLTGVLIPLLGSSASGQLARQQAQMRADISQHVADTARMRDEIWINQAEQLRMDQLDELDVRLGELLAASGRRTGLRHALSQLRVWAGSLAVLAVGLNCNLGDELSGLPGVLVCVALVPGTIAVLETVERVATSLPAGLEATRRIRELAAGEPAVHEPTSPAAPDPTLAGSAALHDVEFSYRGRPTRVLRGVNVEVPAGSLVGIVGATGSGKSTVARLLQRHIDPEAGSVQVAGVDARELGSAQVHDLVALADQEPFIASGTVAENLRLADPNADDQTLRWAAQVAQLDVPMTRPLRHRAESLSGGQRQRLALARTLLRARDQQSGELRGILILDEATSHQDPLTQQRILANLRELDATIVMIAHRLDVLRDADRIYVLEDGEVAEMGTWDELTSQDGAFTALLNA